MNATRKLLFPALFKSAMLGATLIELMISLSIGVIIIGAIGYVFLGSRQSFRTQDALSRMQENARAAFHIIAMDIRLAGFRGCPNNSAAGGDINVLVNNTDWDKNLLDQPLIGYEKPSASTWSSFPTGVTGVVGNVISGDALTVLHADNSQEYIVSAHTPNSDPPQFTLTANHDIKQGQILIAAKPDCSRVAVLQNTKDCTYNSSGDCGHKFIQHDTVSSCSSGNSRKGLGSPIGSCPSGTTDTFDTGSRLFRLSATTYYIANNNGNEPSLYRQVLTTNSGSPNNSAEEMIEGVQDMQISYAIDTGTDLAVDGYVTADNVTDWSKVLGIRLSLLMVSRQDEQGLTSSPQQYAIDMNGDGDTNDTGETITPSDHLLRKVFSTTIAIKNRL
ncbi:PilW family protein [Methylomonas sp. UP202]|uniref:PilW family protein n=1 Tax=Methylomonas sp. UP202 TaxID=3040943 RepID=UPI00247AF407|nr:PilW family protein [Methylomonas sp. UP202]WGS87945.1 PilW family protein [Methylomonas sp. UP202]